MVLGNQGAFVNSERIRHNVLKIKGIVVLGFPKPGNPNKILDAKHPEMLIEVLEIPLNSPVVKIGPGII